VAKVVGELAAVNFGRIGEIGCGERRGIEVKRISGADGYSGAGSSSGDGVLYSICLFTNLARRREGVCIEVSIFRRTLQ
jgi:hypothetical protein